MQIIMQITLFHLSKLRWNVHNSITTVELKLTILLFQSINITRLVISVQLCKFKFVDLRPS